MGIDVSDMSLWEVNACIAGWSKANGAEVDEGLTDSEADQLGALLDAVA